MLCNFELYLTENGLEPEVTKGLYEIINYTQRVLNSFTLQDFEHLDQFYTFQRTPQGNLSVSSCQQQLQFFLNQNPAFRASSKEKICIKIRHFFKTKIMMKINQPQPTPMWVECASQDPSADCSCANSCDFSAGNSYQRIEEV